MLVLDDYHLIGSKQVHESLGFLLEHRPAGVCVVLASRNDPPLSLARRRARGQLTEVRAAELRFTPAEAGELLQHVASALPDASVAALAARTEGWAAGLQLAALSLRGQHDAAAFVAAFTGSHRYVLDYLTEEVLERQDTQLRTFLLETSVLDRLSGPLCDAVTGHEGSQALLQEAERAGLFLIPLDDVRGWWRYHHLFADLLRARVREEQPSRVAQLHRNAAAWYSGHGLADDAIGHAAAAGEFTWAAKLIQRALEAGQTAPDPGRSGLIDPLTGREHEVLTMLAAGRSNQAIARELVVTLDTVKKHVGHVLGKLGAANRTAAVARARELNLIP